MSVEKVFTSTVKCRQDLDVQNNNHTWQVMSRIAILWIHQGACCPQPYPWQRFQWICKKNPEMALPSVLINHLCLLIYIEILETSKILLVSGIFCWPFTTLWEPLEALDLNLSSYVTFGRSSTLHCMHGHIH